MSANFPSDYIEFSRGLAEVWGVRTHAAALYVCEGGDDGANALPVLLYTWHRWRETAGQRGRLHLVWVAPAGVHEKAWSACMEYLPVKQDLPPTASVPGLLRLELEPDVVLTVAAGDPLQMLHRLAGGFDALWLEAGDSAPDMVRASGRLMREGARLVVDMGGAHDVGSAASEDAELLQTLRQTFRRTGFVVVPHGSAPSFEVVAESERESKSLWATFSPPWRTRRRSPPMPAEWPVRSAIVIGAGLAGCAAAHRLTTRGWNVTLFDSADGPARGTSAHRAAALHPHISPDDSHLSRLTRAGHHYGIAHWMALEAAGHAVGWRACGLLQVAMSAEEAALQRSTVEQLGFPSPMVRWLEPDAARELCGTEVTCGGWWFSLGGWVAPPDICAAQLANTHGRLATRWRTPVTRVVRVGEQWHVFDRDDILLARAPVLIIANAGAALDLLPHARLTLTPIPGQLTYVPVARLGAQSTAWPHAVVAGHGYALPIADGIARIGATYETEEAPLSTTAAAVANLARAGELLPAWHSTLSTLDPAALDGYRGVRWVTHNRLPHIGPMADEEAALIHAPHLRGAHLADIPRLPGLYGLLGLGSRGLTWAALGAELLASQIEGEPWPIEQDLAGAIDPARALLHHLRHSPTQAPR